MKVKRIPIAGFVAETMRVRDIGKKEMAKRLGYDEHEPQPTEDPRVVVGQEILHKGEPVRIKADQGSHVLMEGSKGEFLLERGRVIMGSPSTAGWRPPEVKDSGVVEMLEPSQVSVLRPEVLDDIRRALPAYDEIVLYSVDALDQDYTERVKWLLRKERIPLKKIRFEHTSWEGARKW